MAQTLNARPIRSNRQPLTMDQIRQAAPSAFALEPWQNMSARYAYIPTSDVIAGMMQAGFQPYAASQSRTSVEGKAEHTKHMIRFRSPENMSMAVNDVFPEVVLINSHDGTSAYKLMAGMYRLVCSNGLVVADSMIESVSIRHTGNIIQAAAEKSFGLIERMPAALNTVAKWKAIDLTADEAGIFAEAAHSIRFADADGKVNTPIQPRQLLRVRRYDDNSANLWATFNRVQENVLKGGLSAYKPGATIRTTTREVKGIDQDVRLNRSLWTLTERMAELKASGSLASLQN